MYKINMCVYTRICLDEMLAFDKPSTQFKMELSLKCEFSARTGEIERIDNAELFRLRIS